MVSSPRLVGGLHGVRAYSGVFLMMRWMILEKDPGLLPCGTSFATPLSFCGGRCRWGIPSSTSSATDEFEPGV
jgi:hypothetical protein